MGIRLLLTLTCALLAGAAGAAELGESRVASYIGQQLVADIDLALIDAPGEKVAVRLAHPDVYRGANIGMPPVLSTLIMTVTRRDNRQFLHVTSQAPVESSHLHLFLELLDGGQRNVRLVTLSLMPDPNPPPAPAPVAVSAPAFVPAQAPAPVTARAPAVEARPVAVKPAAPRVATPAPTPKPGPAPKPAPEPEPVAPAAPVTAPTPKAVTVAAQAPLPLPVAAGAPATCTPAASSAQACAALDYKSTQLREQIGVLEEKVKVLQVALGASPESVTKPLAPPPAQPHPARKRHAPEPQPDSGLPWGWIGAGVVAVLALAGGALVLLRRRKGRAVAPPRTPLMARLRGRFQRKKTTAEAVEPKLDDAAQEMSTQL